VLKSDSSSLANDCRKEIRALTQQLSKLEGWKRGERRQIQFELRRCACAAAAAAAAALDRLPPGGVGGVCSRSVPGAAAAWHALSSPRW
jgi:hypothetical protein